MKITQADLDEALREIRESREQYSTTQEHKRYNPTPFDQVIRGRPWTTPNKKWVFCGTEWLDKLK
jgi:hypothetical protein